MLYNVDIAGQNLYEKAGGQEKQLLPRVKTKHSKNQQPTLEQDIYYKDKLGKKEQENISEKQKHNTH